ncbi:MAG TPA: glycine betaine ABC transporter substrate-binding protein, partial [Caldilineaceae bacterium]|nr:glycine betaine ABC transporter substrate-binding protein [Caldilineaceae bacterium]
MELDEVYNALRQGECDVAEGYSTDGRGAAWGFHNLADPLALFPFYNPAPVVRKPVLDANPALAPLLEAVISRLDDATMSQLNARVDIGGDGEPASGDEETPAAVARDFLVSAALIPPDSPAGVTVETSTEQPADGAAGSGAENTDSQSIESSAGITTGQELTATQPLTTADPASATADLDLESAPPGEIVVASTDRPEEVLLGQLYLLLLEEAGLPVADRTGLGAPDVVRRALAAGTIDLYPELSGRALADYYHLPPSAWPANPERSYALAKSLDQPQGYLWLARMRVQTGVTLLVPQALAGQGVRSISEFARWIGGETDPFKLCVDDRIPAETPAALAAVYDIPLAPHQLIRVVGGETYAGLRNGACDGAFGQPGDGRVAAWQLVALEDDRGFFYSSVAAPVVRNAVHTAYPSIDAALQPLALTLDNAHLSRASAQTLLGADGEPATGDEIPVQAAASALLCDLNLRTRCANGGDQPTADAVASQQLPTASTELTLTASSLRPRQGADAGVTILVSTPISIGVNARVAPSTQADILDLLPASTQVQAIGRSPRNDWLRIILPDGQLAWVFANAVLAPGQSVATLPVIDE